MWDESYLHSFTMMTSKGNKSPRFGGDGGNYAIVTFPEGYRLIGIYGVVSEMINKFGFVLGRTVYPSSSDYEQIQDGAIKEDLLRV